MKTLGIVGGIAPESTVEYYRAVIAIHRERTGAYPHLVINSIDLPRMLGLVGSGRREELVAYLSAELAALKRAGADLAIFASNTPHIVFEELRAVSPLPLISIVDCAGAAAVALGLRRLALFGTRFTMQADFYRTAFARLGIDVISPDAADQDLIHTRYMDELVNGRFLPETRDEILDVAARMHDAHAIDGVILGGTELPLLLREETSRGLRLIDTGRIHAAAAVEAMLA